MVTDDTRPPTDPETMKALGAFAAKVAVAILYDDPKGGDQIGTGSLHPACSSFVGLHRNE